MVRGDPWAGGIYGRVILTTRPSLRGFISKYLLGLSPVVITVLSLLALSLLEHPWMEFFTGILQPLVPLVPDPSQYIMIALLLVTPAGIFLFCIWLGDLLRYPEVAIGSALTLLLSGAGAIVVVQGQNLPLLTTGYLLAAFRWVAYLVQPAGIIASICVIVGTEAYRRTITYTLAGTAVIITGGLWKQVENVIPLHQIERVSLLQSWAGRLLRYGTVIPAGKVLGLSGTGTTAHDEEGETRQPDTLRMIHRLEGSHDPLLCLYGILDPSGVQSAVSKAMQEQAG